MSTTPSRPNGDATPAPPVFSYAQAAKGRAASTTASAMQSHQSTASGISTPAKEPQSTINTPSAGSERGDRSVNGSVEAPSKVEVTESSRNTETKASTSLRPSSSTASPSFGTASTSTLPKEDKDDDFTLVGGPDSNKDRHSAATDKNADGEGRRAKKGKKQKNAEKEAEKETEKEKEEVKPEVFVPAPLPTVNFWQQRKEEAAKAKPSPVVGQSPQTVGPSSGDLNSTPNGKIAEKKRGKTEETLSPSQNGTPKDAQSANRGQKKGGDTPGKKEDPSGKRTGARGSRANEKDEKAAASQLPPPVEDAISWPTPETALEEEKRKAQEKFEKEDKDETVSNKPRPKEKWVAVPYTPSVTFNTPLPTRGGRGRGGARGGRTEAGGRTGHSTNGTGEKLQNASATEASPADRDSRSSSVPPTNKSRPSTEPSSGRKPSVAQGGEKAKTSSSKNESTSDIRNLPNGGQPDQSFEVSQDTRGDNKGLKQEQNFFETQSYQRSSADRKVDQSMRAPDQFKDNSNFNKDGLNQSRGNDGQSNRGRGGFRGRAGHGTFANGQPHPQNVFTNGHGGPPPPNGYSVRQASGPYSPPLQPLPFSNQYAPPPSRGGRGGSRSQSIPNNGMYGRYPPNGGLAQHMSPIQTSNLYDYQHMQGPMSAQPYQPYMDQVSVLQMVTMQLEYYFSIDNLCKDVFLRKHMDSQGFVFLAFIAGFKRIQALTQEFELLRFACQESSIIELVRGDDGHDRLRRKEGWEKWVFKGMEERDESVRNAGPTFHQRSQQNQHRGSMVMPNQQTMSPVAFSSNGTEAGFHQYTNGNGIPAPALSNGNGGAYFPETPLSAAVPDFSPGVLPTLSNGGTSEPLDIETTFSDDEVAHLILVFKAPKGSEDSKPKSPFHSMPSRTFSNGSIDGRSIAEELYDDQRQSRSLVNGSHASETGSPDSLRRPRSPFGAMSPTQSSFNNGPPVMWVKGQKQQAFVSPGSSEELYTKFRSRALQHRETSAPGESHADMKLLYEFWSHFLCRNFNAAMYQEFRNFAFEDAQSKAMSGVTSLISYYAEVLSSKKKVIPSVLALHYVDLVKNEDPSGPRPALEKLRVAWRDGALDMKSRKRIDSLVDSKLREELERAPHQKSDLS